MKKIRGLIIFMVGILLGIFSYFTKNPSFKLLVYIGFVMAIVGIIDLLLGIVKMTFGNTKKEWRVIFAIAVLFCITAIVIAFLLK